MDKTSYWKLLPISDIMSENVGFITDEFYYGPSPEETIRGSEVSCCSERAKKVLAKTREIMDKGKGCGKFLILFCKEKCSKWLFTEAIVTCKTILQKLLYVILTRRTFFKYIKSFFLTILSFLIIFIFFLYI